MVCSIFFKRPELIFISNKIRLNLITTFVMSINRHISRKTPYFFLAKKEKYMKKQIMDQTG